MAKRKARGLGDTIENITKATGIKAVVDKVSEITGIDCGCEGRKEILNKLFPYEKPECLLENELEVLQPYLNKIPTEITPVEQYAINNIYKRVFRQRNVEFTTCGSCLLDRINKLLVVAKEYANS